MAGYAIQLWLSIASGVYWACEQEDLHVAVSALTAGLDKQSRFHNSEAIPCDGPNCPKPGQEPSLLPIQYQCNCIFALAGCGKTGFSNGRHASEQPFACDLGDCD